ncbi:MAG: D-alanyl-D-alanine carboxypeptidase [Thermodesulfobacteriota bacterium]
MGSKSGERRQDTTGRRRLSGGRAGRWLALALVAAALFLLLPGPLPAATVHLPAALDSRLTRAGFLVGPPDHPVLARDPDQALVPASILKIATSLVALTLLGPDFHFHTQFFQDGAGHLIVRGLGDPGLTSREVAAAAARLAALGLASYQDLVLDASAFQVGPTDGAEGSFNPYDAACGALVLNFNTVALEKTAAGHVRSAEAETPDLPMMAELSQGLPPGRHRLNVSRRPGEALRHAGQLLDALLAQAGIRRRGVIRQGTLLEPARLLLDYESQPALTGTVQGLLAYSNNLVANQLFLQCGVVREGLPATFAKGQRTVAAVLRERWGLAVPAIRLEEGSGLSRQNAVTPAAMAVVLEAFRPYALLLPEAHGQLLKTGTLRGVYSYAGYFRDGNDLVSVVLMLNQTENLREELLAALLAAWHQAANR